MGKRYLSGMLIAIPSINLISFTPKSSINNVMIDVNYNERVIQIFYNPKGTYVSEIYYPGITIIEDQILDLSGCYELLPTAICNGIEYVQSIVPCKGIYQHFISNNKLHHTGIIEYDTNIYIMISDSEIPNNLDEYLSLINKSKLCYAHKIDNSEFNLTNIYFMPFDNEVYNYADKSVSGLTKEWVLNDVVAASCMIDELREMYPEIQFYTDEQDKDQDHYNEWIKYDIRLSSVNSSLFTNHVLVSDVYGHYWPTTLSVDMEYSAIDLPTLLARRDEYRGGHFLNDFRVFDVKLGENNPIQCATFWNRNDLPDDYQKVTSQDSTGYSLYTYKYTGSLIYVNLQYKNTDLTIIEEVVCQLITQKINNEININIDLTHNIKNEDYVDKLGDGILPSTTKVDPYVSMDPLPENIREINGITL